VVARTGGAARGEAATEGNDAGVGGAEDGTGAVGVADETALGAAGGEDGILGVEVTGLDVGEATASTAGAGSVCARPLQTNMPIKSASTHATPG
jgi:fermentation-respiration switch protein FrsA (DUF1100 family)